MSAVVFLLIAVAIAAVGFVRGVPAQPTPRRRVDSGIDDFRREMHALAPRPDEAGATIWEP